MCYICGGVCEGQEKVSDPLKVKIHMAVSHLLGVLGAELGCSGRARNGLNS